MVVGGARQPRTAGRSGGVRNRATSAVRFALVFALALTSELVLPALSPRPSGVALAQTPARTWTIDPSQSKLIVHVHPGGLLSPALHPHHFQPENWSGEIAWDPARPRTARVEVRVAADSLRDHQEKLSPKDIAKVETQARGPAILDAAQFPQIVFSGDELEVAKTPAAGKGEFRGTLTGNLTLHGKTMRVGFAIQGLVSADRFEASAAANFNQSDFGIKPYKTALGTISVKDQITLEITIVALPPGKKAPASPTAVAAEPEHR